MISSLITHAKLLRAAFWGDWRGKLVVGFIGLALVVSAAIWMIFPSSTDPTTFGGAAFASWMSGLLLFCLTGLIIGIVTLVRPDQEIFEARARNLLQRQTGPHINYIVAKLHQQLEPYVDESSRRVTVVGYDTKRRMFLVNQETKMRFRSYLVDIPVVFESQVGYVNGTPAGNGQQPACFTYLKVNGVRVGDVEEFRDRVIRPFQIKVTPDSPCTVEHRMTFWIRAEIEPNRQLIRRFTRKMTVEIHNQLAAQSIRVVQPSDPDLDRELPPGERAVVVNLTERPPGENNEDFAFDFRLVPA